MVNSKRYKDELNNRVILERDDEDFILRVRYDKEQFCHQPEDTEWLITRKDFEKMQELDMEDKLNKLKGGLKE